MEKFLFDLRQGMSNAMTLPLSRKIGHQSKTILSKKEEKKVDIAELILSMRYEMRANFASMERRMTTLEERPAPSSSSEQEEFEYESFSREEIEAKWQQPRGQKSGKKYPANHELQIPLQNKFKVLRSRTPPESENEEDSQADLETASCSSAERFRGDEEEHMPDFTKQDSLVQKPANNNQPAGKPAKRPADKSASPSGVTNAKQSGLAEPDSLESFIRRISKYREVKGDSRAEKDFLTRMNRKWSRMPSDEKIAALFTETPSPQASQQILTHQSHADKQALLEAWNSTLLRKQIEYERIYEEIAEHLADQPPVKTAATSEKSPKAAPKQSSKRKERSEVEVEEGEIVLRQPEGFIIEGVVGYDDRTELLQEITRFAPNIKFAKIQRLHKRGIYIRSTKETKELAEELFLKKGLPADAFRSQKLYIHPPGEQRQRPEDGRKIVVIQLERSLPEQEVMDELKAEGVEVDEAFWLTGDQRYSGKLCIVLKDEEVAKDFKAKGEIKLNYCFYEVEGYKPTQKPVQCFRCLEFEHISPVCKEPEEKQKCLRCGKTGHSNKDCPVPIGDTKQFKCANCGKNHLAIDKKCQSYIDAKKKLDDTIKAKAEKAAKLKDAPAPTTNAWTVNGYKEKIDALIIAIKKFVEEKAINEDEIRHAITAIICP